MRFDTKHLQAGEGVISLARSALKTGSSLCDFCAISPECQIREPGTTSCQLFAPALSFAPPILGLDGRFSTFRASSVWYDRARIIRNTSGNVGLFNTQTGERIGLATLTNAIRGPFRELMKHHAASNHLCQAKNIDRAEAETWLPRQIRNLAGSRYVKSPDQICTVIYLERHAGP